MLFQLQGNDSKLMAPPQPACIATFYFVSHGFHLIQITRDFSGLYLGLYIYYYAFGLNFYLPIARGIMSYFSSFIYCPVFFLQFDYTKGCEGKFIIQAPIASFRNIEFLRLAK